MERKYSVSQIYRENNVVYQSLQLGFCQTILLTRTELLTIEYFDVSALQMNHHNQNFVKQLQN